MAIVCTTNEGLYAKCTEWLPNSFKFQTDSENIFECEISEIELEVGID